MWEDRIYGWVLLSVQLLLSCVRMFLLSVQPLLSCVRLFLSSVPPFPLSVHPLLSCVQLFLLSVQQVLSCGGEVSVICPTGSVMWQMVSVICLTGSVLCIASLLQDARGKLNELDDLI